MFLGKVLLHRVGVLGTLGCTAGLTAATVTGAIVGREAFERHHDRLLHAIVAVGVGAILRSLLHRSAHYADAHPAYEG